MKAKQKQDKAADAATAERRLKDAEAPGNGKGDADGSRGSVRKPEVLGRRFFGGLLSQKYLLIGPGRCPEMCTAPLALRRPSDHLPGNPRVRNVW